MVIPIILAIVAAGGIGLLFFGVLSTFQTESEFEARLDTVMGRRLPSGEGDEQKGPSTSQAVAAAVNERLSKGGYGAKVADGLARADVKLTLGEFMMGQAGTAL